MSEPERTAALLEAVQQVHATRSLGEFERLVPPLMRALIGVDVVAYQEIDLPRRETRAVITPDMPGPSSGAELDAALARLLSVIATHPVYRRITTSGDGSAAAISDLWSRERYRSSSLYRSVLRDVGTEDQLVIALPSASPVVIGVPMSRGRWGFTASEKRLADRMRPHLAQARDNLLLLERMRRELDERDDRLAAAGLALLGLDADGRIDGSPAAISALQSAAALERGRLGGTAAAWWQEQRRLRRAGAPQRTVRLGGGEHRILLRAVGDDAAVLRRTGVVGARALLALGLTDREADVVRGMVDGISDTAQLAQRLGVAPATVRRHLESVNRKLGTHGRAEIVAAALDAATMAGDPELVAPVG